MIIVQTPAGRNSLLGFFIEISIVLLYRRRYSWLSINQYSLLIIMKEPAAYSLFHPSKVPTILETLNEFYPGALKRYLEAGYSVNQTASILLSLLSVFDEEAQLIIDNIDKDKERH